MMYAMAVMILLMGPVLTLLFVLLMLDLLQVPGYRFLPQGA